MGLDAMRSTEQMEARPYIRTAKSEALWPVQRVRTATTSLFGYLRAPRRHDICLVGSCHAMERWITQRPTCLSAGCCATLGRYTPSCTELSLIHSSGMSPVATKLCGLPGPLSSTDVCRLWYSTRPHRSRSWWCSPRCSSAPGLPGCCPCLLIELLLLPPWLLSSLLPLPLPSIILYGPLAQTSRSS